MCSRNQSLTSLLVFITSHYYIIIYILISLFETTVQYDVGG